VPAGLVHGAMTLWEWLHARLGLPRPPLLSLEVRKIAVSHYNRIDRARRDFGYAPKVAMEEALVRCLEHCRGLVAQRQAPAERAQPGEA
jgi:3beta-hydroxy-delta5-steroid dehydrogenase/steroid delta-isomerase